MGGGNRAGCDESVLYASLSLANTFEATLIPDEYFNGLLGPYDAYSPSVLDPFTKT